MTNMNHFKDPAVYGLTDPDGRVFYVGITTVNALNRWWQHRYRARINHPAPVYVRWNEIGLDQVGFVVLQNLTPDDDPLAVEAEVIAGLLAEGHVLVNQKSRDGVAESMSAESKEKVGRSNKGKDTWIKGKTGHEAGWTEERKQAQRDRIKAKQAARVPNHGSRTEYIKYKCRCDACRSNYSRLQEEYRIRIGRKKEET